MVVAKPRYIRDPSLSRLPVSRVVDPRPLFTKDVPPAQNTPRFRIISPRPFFHDAKPASARGERIVHSSPIYVGSQKVLVQKSLVSNTPSYGTADKPKVGGERSRIVSSKPQYLERQPGVGKASSPVRVMNPKPRYIDQRASASRIERVVKASPTYFDSQTPPAGKRNDRIVDTQPRYVGGEKPVKSASAARTVNSRPTYLRPDTGKPMTAFRVVNSKPIFSALGNTRRDANRVVKPQPIFARSRISPAVRLQCSVRIAEFGQSCCALSCSGVNKSSSQILFGLPTSTALALETFPRFPRSLLIAKRVPVLARRRTASSLIRI